MPVVLALQLCALKQLISECLPIIAFPEAKPTDGTSFIGVKPNTCGHVNRYTGRRPIYEFVKSRSDTRGYEPPPSLR